MAMPKKARITAPKPTEAERDYARQLGILADQAAERARLDVADAIRMGEQLAEERRHNPDPVELHRRAIEAAEWAQRSHSLAVSAEALAANAEAPIRRYDEQVRAKAAQDELIERHLEKVARNRCDIQRISFAEALAEVRAERASGSWRLPFEH